MTSYRPLFIPLIKRYYEKFVNLEKDTEYRLFGPRWNLKTCYVGRRVVISNGYGTHRRAMGYIDKITVCKLSELPVRVHNSIISIYRIVPADQRIICIKLRDLKEIVISDCRQ